MRESESGVEAQSASEQSRSIADERTLVAEDRLTAADTISGTGGEDEWSEPGVSPQPPARIGDYIVLHHLGEGGMGIIYAAYDEGLDRKIAVKLLRSSTRHRARLEREAKALARLNHPNIVQVYEIGMFEGAPYIAMEFVDGVTLDAWLEAEPRSLDAILAVFREAGRGLAIAHQKHLIHRDFKPTNVMVRHDGRVAVMDFGLARGNDGDSLEDAEEDVRPLLSGLLQSDLTLTGAMMGTPAYMAPEQFVGGETDVHTDQFSFCVALWQAIHGERPFGGDNLAAISVSVTQGELRPPARREVPGWLNKVIARGLEVRPEDRWESMEALLEALEADPGQRRRTVAIAGGLLGVLFVGSGSLLWVEQRERDELAATCQTESEAIYAEWNEATMDAAAASFEATKLSYANESYTRAAEWMERYAGQWQASRLAACRAHHLEASIDADFYAAQSACLDEHAEVFTELARSWTDASEHTVRRAVRVAAELPRIEPCADERWLSLREEPPSDPETRERVEALEAELVLANAQKRAGEREQALLSLEQTLVAAQVLGWDPLIAKVELARGSVLRDLAKFDEARAAFESAFLAAGRAGDDLQALEAASRMTGLLGMILAEFDEGRHWARLAGMLLDRMDLRGTTQEAGVLNPLGAIQAQTGEGEAAIVSFGGALEIWRSVFGDEHPLAAKALGNLAVAHMKIGNLDESIAVQEQALAIREATLGEHHPDIAHSLLNLGLAVEQSGNAERALELYRRALAIREEVHGPRHPEVAAIVHAIAGCHETAGELDQARTSYERALEINSATLEPNHPEVLDAHVSLGRVLFGLGRLEDARGHLEIALAGYDPEQVSAQRIAQAQFDTAKVAHAQGDLVVTRELVEVARAGFLEGEQSKSIAALDEWVAGTLEAPASTESSAD